MVHPGHCKVFKSLEDEISEAEGIGKNRDKCKRDKILEELGFHAEVFHLLFVGFPTPLKRLEQDRDLIPFAF